MQKGFTLIELLVVVLIIGVLAAIAIPQYETAVEKSRMTEGFVNLKAMSDSAQRFFQANPDDTLTYKANIADVDLKGGTWTNDTIFKTKLFEYTIVPGKIDEATITAQRKDGETLLYTLTMFPGSGTASCTAETGYEDMCKLFNGIF